MNVYPMANAFSLFWFTSGLMMLVPHFVFTLFLEKRSFFIIRSVAGILLFSLGAYLTCFTDQWHERYYLLLHLAGALYLAFCSKCSFKMIVYFNIWCVVLYYFIFQIQALSGVLFRLHHIAVPYYADKIFFTAVLVILEIILIKSLLRKDIYNLPVSQVLIAGLISAAIIAFNSITFEANPEEGYTKYIFQVFSMLCNLLAIYLQAVASYSQKKNYENEYIQHMLRSSKKDHELKSEYIDLINHKYHDLKHEIRALRQMESGDRTEYIDSIEKTVDQFGNLFQTENELLDAILNDVRRHCEREQIMFSCIVNCSNLDFIEVVDLSVLLGNMLDNAIEAAEKLPEENRVVDLKLLTDEHFFRISEKNTYTGELKITSDGLASSKSGNGYHGFGSQSMKYIVDKYHGKIAMDANEGIFSLHVIIPVPTAS